MDFIMGIGIMFMFLSVIILHGVRNNCISGGPTVLKHKKNINAPKPKPYPKDDIHVRDI